MTRGASMKKVTFYRNHFLTSQEEKSQEVKKPQLQNLTTLSARCGYFLKKLEIPRRNSDSLHHLSSRCRAGDSVALGVSRQAADRVQDALHHIDASMNLLISHVKPNSLRSTNLSSASSFS